jgi:hypothetical protein
MARLRAGSGPLPGQTFETVIDNPSAYHFFRGFDLLFTSGPDNNVPGDNTAALRLSVFNYFASNWDVSGTGTGLYTYAPVPGVQSLSPVSGPEVGEGADLTEVRGSSRGRRRR